MYCFGKVRPSFTFALVAALNCVLLAPIQYVFADENNIKGGNIEWIELPQNLEQFPILSPGPGGEVVECGERLKGLAWRIGQWNNDKDQSVCINTANSKIPEECIGASWVRSSSGASLCYWKETKKIRIAINTAKMSYGGCCIYCNEASRMHPGGYGSKLEWKSKDMPDFGIGDRYWVKNLKAIIISTGFSQEAYVPAKCPQNIPKPPLRSPKAPEESVAHAHANVFFSQVDPVTNKSIRTVLFGTYLWDSRANWSNRNKSFVDCDFPSGSARWTVVARPITGLQEGVVLGSMSKLSSHINEIGSRTSPQTLQMKWDILPTLKKELSQCFGPEFDVNELRILAVYFGHEVFNSAQVVTTFVDPKMGLVQK